MCCCCCCQSSDHARLEDEFISLRGKLEMNELHLQQLQNSGEQLPAAADVTHQIESLLAEKTQLQTRIEQVLRRVCIKHFADAFCMSFSWLSRT